LLGLLNTHLIVCVAYVLRASDALVCRHQTS